MSDTPIQRLGDYEILNELGAGGMGRVYRVRNVLTDRIEAMKVLLPNLQGHEEVAARFLREIKVLAALDHPNIASLHTALTIENQLVMVMEFVEGRSLSSRLDAGPIGVTEALGYLEQVLGALSYAHKQHVIHRDIKPANMMLTRQGMVKLMDFGIAHAEGTDAKKLTATGSTLGSISYMSPEQVKGEKTDERSDLYSLGISLYEMVTGKRPFDVGSSFSIMAAHINQAPQPPMEVHPGLPQVVNDLILTSIAKAPGDRFQSAEAFRAAVKQALSAVPADDRTMVQGSIDNTFANAPTASNPAWPSVPLGANDRTMVQGSSDNTIANTPTASNPAVPVAMPPRAPAAPATPNRQAFAAAAAAPPAAAAPAVATTPAPPPAATASSHRGLYMALGALVVVVALVAAGLYMPGHKKASAADAVQTPPAQQMATPTPASAPAPAAAPAPTATTTAAPAPSVDTQAAARAKAQKLAQEKAAAEAAAAQAAAEAERKAQLDAVEHRIDQLTGRAGAVNSSLNTLKQQQAASGYGLRGDMASAQSRLNVNLAKAQDAIQHEDLDRARRYASQTEQDLETLEKFLGR